MNAFYLYYENTVYTEIDKKIVSVGNFISQFKFLFSKIKNNENTAILMLYANFTQPINENLIDFINKTDIKKIIFLVEDVLRLYNTSINYKNMHLTTYHIWTSPDTVKSPQIDFIVATIDQLQIDYKIFLCEYDTDILEKNYNIELRYYDFFSNKFINDNVHYLIKNKDKIEYKISNFNLRDEPHRFILAHALSSLDGSLVTCNWRYDRNWILNNNNFSLSKFPSYYYDKFLKNIEKNNFGEILWDSSPDDIKKNSIEHNQSLLFDYSRQGNNLKIYQKSFCNVITETRFNSPWPNFTEKTIKSIIACRPFILCAPVGTLKLLKKLGFKTFDRLWDESYDEIEDPYQRFMAIFNIVESITTKDYNILNKMLKGVQSITDHNFHQLKNFNRMMLNMNPDVFRLD